MGVCVRLPGWLGLVRPPLTTGQHLQFRSGHNSLPHSFLEMGNSRSSLQLQQEEIDEITSETGFTKQQIERLYARFSSLDKQSHGFLTREDFLRIPELAINPLGDRIVHAFFYESKSQGEEKVDFKDFVRVVAHFRPVKKNPAKNKLNTRHEKLHFAFRMYDLDGDDKISKVLERTDVEQKMSI